MSGGRLAGPVSGLWGAGFEPTDCMWFSLGWPLCVGGLGILLLLAREYGFSIVSMALSWLPVPEAAVPWKPGKCGFKFEFEFWCARLPIPPSGEITSSCLAVSCERM